ncbi:MAG TPA: aminoacetone oxidase family FAD-binding enzyme, partial [Desulfobacteraceae bacterium]|nr:aminoacetone oxidase family FAD-binding enzyme [Desulfobacteraceae bacterium]
MVENWDTVIIGAGASGLVCAAEAGQRQRQVLVLDHNKRPGQKILMSGGGRCNFTNREVSAEQFISRNPHFCKSALKRFSARNFLDWIRSAGIRYEERDHGQLFCRDKASQILDMLMD